MLAVKLLELGRDVLILLMKNTQLFFPHTVEREKRKDELLDIAKSKQDRTNSELQNLRQIYVKQQSDLQFLNFNVENSQELIQIHGLKMEEPKALECRLTGETKVLVSGWKNPD